MSEVTYQRDAGRVSFGKVNLATLIVNATDLPRDRISGPAWLDSVWFQFAATMPPDTTNEQLREMFMSLLKDRFGFRYHDQPREVRGYSLIVGRHGPKLMSATASVTQSHQGWYIDPQSDGVAVIHCPDCSMAMLAGALTKVINGGQSDGRDNVTPVVNKTELGGRYSIKLEIEVDSTDRPVLGGVAPAAIRRALQDQVGLTLGDTKTIIHTVVVDHAERSASPN